MDSIGLFVEDVCRGLCNLEAEADKFLCFIDVEFRQEQAARQPCSDRREDIELEYFFKDGLSRQDQGGGGSPGLCVVEKRAKVDEGLFFHGMGVVDDNDGERFVGVGLEVFLKSREKVFSS